jgi:hypothetical protein
MTLRFGSDRITERKLPLDEQHKLAAYIHNNITASDYNEKLLLYKKILTENRLNRELLAYELRHYQPEQVKTFNDVVSAAEKYLARYHQLAGGFLLEDNKWNLHKHDDKIVKYQLKANEVIFDNSLLGIYKYDGETISYVKALVGFLSRLSGSIRTTYKYINEPHDDIVWIVLFCTPIKN